MISSEEILVLQQPPSLIKSTATNILRMGKYVSAHIQTQNSDFFTLLFFSSQDVAIRRNLDFEMVDPFEAFNEVLRRILICLRSEDHMDKFRNTVSIITQKISLHLRQECEEFGVNLKMYESLMAYNKANRVKFKNLLDLGRFSFEGRSEYNSILLVVTVGNGEDVLSSHIPKEWLQKVDEEVKEEMIGKNNQEIVGSKRKAKVRGPGSKDFKSAKTAAVLSKPLLDKILKIIGAEVGEYQVNNRNEIIEHLIQSIWKQQNISEKMKDDCAKFNSKIVYSLREFFVGLKDVGRQFKQVENR